MRISHVCLWILITVVGISSWPAGLHAETSAAELGYQLREALGFDARTLAALGVSANTYGLIASDATDFCDENRQAVEPLLAAVATARAEATSAYEN